MNRLEVRSFALSLILGQINDEFLALDACYRDGAYSDADVERIERAFDQIEEVLQRKMSRTEAALARNSAQKEKEC